jgi:hypothetical protein
VSEPPVPEDDLLGTGRPPRGAGRGACTARGLGDEAARTRTRSPAAGSLGQTDASYVERPALRARTFARRCPSRYSGWRDGRNLRGRAFWSSPSTSSATGSVPASEVGKAIVETDEKHAGDELRIPSASMAGLCNEGMPDTMSEACRVTYLARHALGKDLDRGPHESSISLSDVADFCDSGAIDKSFELCKRAYAARNAAMK